MTVLLASDLHLDPAQPARVEAFLRFLAGPARDAASLYLLGDLFEAWVGDDDDDPMVERVAEALATLTESGVSVHFQRGNRDFLLGAGYAARCGMTLLDEAEVRPIGGMPTLLMHGDQLCTRDLAYQAFRRQARDPAWQRQVLAQPLAARRALAVKARAESRAHTADTSAEIMDVDPDAVRDALAAHGVRRLIHGHTHRPAIHRFAIADGDAERIVLPDWHARAGWAVIDGPTVILVEQPLDA
jgi:UDP-2,3-diacylglucosamine hydrolase